MKNTRDARHQRNLTLGHVRHERVCLCGPRTSRAGSRPRPVRGPTRSRIAKGECAPHVSYSLLRSAVHAGTRQRISPCQTHDTHLHQLAAHTTARRQIQIHTTASHSGLPVRWRCCAVQYQLPSQELHKSQVQHAEGRYREHALLFCAPFALANGAIVCLSCHRLSMSPSSSTQPSPARTDPTVPAWWAAAF